MHPDSLLRLRTGKNQRFYRIFFRFLGFKVWLNSIWFKLSSNFEVLICDNVIEETIIQPKKN